jgi:hypothetical protein
MDCYSFDAVLERPEGVGTWTFLSIPLEVSSTFGAKGQVRVKGSINGYPFRSTALPMGDGTHYLVVGKDIRQQIDAAQGDTVKVTLEIDIEERRVELPEELRPAFDRQPQAAAAFEKMTYSHQKEWINWILSAKQAPTRQRRVEKALALIAQGKNRHELSRRQG